MYAIKVCSHFSAAHNLRGYRGKCEKLHGHNWRVEAKLAAAELSHLAMVCDFHELKKRLQKVLQKLDHSYLNRLTYFRRNNPTSEKLAEFIYIELNKLVRSKKWRLKEITVWETESSGAIFTPLDSKHLTGFSEEEN